MHSARVSYTRVVSILCKATTRDRFILFNAQCLVTATYQLQYCSVYIQLYTFLTVTVLLVHCDNLIG